VIHLLPSQHDLKQRIIAHCAHMAQYDRAYAVWAYKQYREQLPWLGL